MPRSEEHVQTKKSVATRARIIDAAATVLVEVGYAETTLKLIAKRADLKAGSLYYHFQSRDDLVETVLATGLDRAYEEVRSGVAALPSDASAAEKVREAVRCHLLCTIANDMGRASLRTMGNIPPAMRRRFYSKQRRYGAYWHNLLMDMQQAEDIDSEVDLVKLRFLIFGALNWVVEWPESARLPVPKLVDTTCEFLLSGLFGVGRSDVFEESVRAAQVVA